MSKSIEFVVDPEGGVEIEAFGYKGADCLEATRVFERALGKTGNRTMKTEFADGKELQVAGQRQ